MRRQQVIQILQFVLAWILVFCLVVFVFEESFVDFVLKYWIYLLLVSISYFYYYSIKYELDKKFEYIRNAIIYGNLYLFAHIFFRPLLNISHELFVLLWLIILLLWWSSKMRSRWKYLLQTIGWVFCFFILISGIFYLYPEEPNIWWFVDSKVYQLSTMWIYDKIPKNDAYIQIENSKKSDNFQISSSFSKILSENNKISYPSLKKDRDGIVYIISPQWDLFLLFPQSEIQTQFSWNNLISLANINWRVRFFTWMFDSSIKYIWENAEISQEMWNYVEEIQNLYKSDLVSFLKNQISGNKTNLTNSNIMQDIDGIILKFLAKMFPASFSKNLKNYEYFQYYFSMVKSDKINLNIYANDRSEEITIKSLRSNIKENMNFGRNNAIKDKKKYKIWQ